jgi:mxaA protein
MRGWAAVVIYLLLTGLAAAQVRSIEDHSDRAFGYFVGDVIHRDIDVVVDPGFRLEPASAPKPGPITYWLDLTEAKVTESSSSSERRYKLKLTYQLFYVALDPRKLEIPKFQLLFTNGDRSVPATIEAWRFNVSPLREVEPAAVDNPSDYLQPDAPAKPIDLGPVARWTAGFGVATILALLLVACDRAWAPFRKRPGRPFTVAARRIHELMRGGEETAYLPALQILHRAVDDAAGHRVLADDLPTFLEERPQFKALAPDFGRFFDSSRDAFFGADPATASLKFPASTLVAFGDGLAAAERGTP